jgi:hypothetical protein
VKANAEILNTSNNRMVGELVNISEGGAMIGRSSGMRIGDTGSLRLEGLSAPLPFVARGQQDEAFHVEFQLTEPLGATFMHWFNQRVSTALAEVS